MFGTDENLPEYVVTAHNVDPYFRVKMQGEVQKYIDSSISSTVNLAEDTTVDTVRLQGWCATHYMHVPLRSRPVTYSDRRDRSQAACGQFYDSTQ